MGESAASVALTQSTRTLIQRAEGDNAIKVLVFKSADPDYFIPHVDVTQISEFHRRSTTAVRRPDCARCQASSLPPNPLPRAVGSHLSATIGYGDCERGRLGGKSVAERRG
jgi:hypothetical protein